MTQRREILAGLSALAALSAADAMARPARKSAKKPAPAPVDPAVAALAALAPEARAKLDAALAGAHRSDANKARDAQRRPAEVLAFFGVTPTSSVLEVIPGGGWFTEILAAYLRDTGKLSVWAGDPNNAGQRRGLGALMTKFAGDAKTYDQVRFDGPWLAADQRVAPGSLDAVLTFRNVHNLVWFKLAEPSFKLWFDALKPGGVLGVEDHRWPDGVANDKKPNTPFNAPDNGYISEAAVIALATGAGFQLAAKSEVNANPKDTKDYAQGVWALPPTLIGGEADPDRAKLLAIGESDRMILKFVKPA